MYGYDDVDYYYATRRRVTSSQDSPSNPFDGINVGPWRAPALGDFDGDGTFRPRPSTEKLRLHKLWLAQATWTSSWAIPRAISTTWRTPGRLRRRCSWQGPKTITPSTASTLALTASPHSETSTATVRSDRVRRSINCDRMFCVSRRRLGSRRGQFRWHAQLFRQRFLHYVVWRPRRVRRLCQLAADVRLSHGLYGRPVRRLPGGVFWIHVRPLYRAASESTS